MESETEAAAPMDASASPAPGWATRVSFCLHVVCVIKVIGVN